MRVRPLLRRVRDDERGAALMIVGLSLLIILGMLVLTVDLGRGVAYKRQLVTGADAAALAAAQDCALGGNPSSARAVGDSTLASNVDLSGLRSTYEMPGCGSEGSANKVVTVTATADIDYFFAGIFGFDSGDVAARAVAVYGTVPTANPIPITVDQQQLLNNCGIVAGNPPNEQVDDCDLDYPKDALEEPRWGVLDLDQWGDPDAAPCTVDSSTLKDMIEGGGWPGDELPAPNYDCLDNGLAFSVWAEMEGRILVFPVIDILRSTGEVKPGRNHVPCTGADIPALQAAGFDCQIDTAYIVGFIRLRVDSVVNTGSTVQIETTYLGPSTGNGLPCVPGIDCTVEDFGLRAVRLVE